MNKCYVSAAVSRAGVKRVVKEILSNHVLTESEDECGGDVTLVDALSVDDERVTGHNEIDGIAGKIAKSLCRFDPIPIASKWEPQPNTLYWTVGASGVFEAAGVFYQDIEKLWAEGRLFRSKHDAEEYVRACVCLKNLRDAEDGGKVDVYANLDGVGLRITGIGFSTPGRRSNFLNNFTKDDLNLVAKLMYGRW